MTMGTKDPMCADTQCGAWTDTREYYVELPMGYDQNKAYPLLLEGPGCGGRGNDLYKIPALSSSLIRVGQTFFRFRERQQSSVFACKTIGSQLIQIAPRATATT